MKNSTPFLSISFLNIGKCCQLGLPAEIKVHATADVNCAILTKCVKLQLEKKPVSNLISMQSVGFEQIFMKFTEIFIPQE